MKRQVILIMTDTTRKDMVGCYGDFRMKTPNLDLLASQGIRYENCYSCQPVCGPARSAIFTGLFPHSNGMVTNSIAMGSDIKTVGQRLSNQGIHCGYVGKWHLDGGDYFGYGKCPEGWDPNYWYDMKCYLDELSEEDRVRSRDSNTSYSENMTREFTYAHRCSNRAISFLNEHVEDDFFFCLSYDEPHGPSLSPAPFCTMYDDFKFNNKAIFEDDLVNKPLMQRLWANERLSMSAEELCGPSSSLSLFLGCNSFVDDEIGRVMKVINEKYPEAIVIFTSDHGDMLNAHRLNMKNATAYKEAANIPLIIKGGEKGKVVHEPASHIDIVPTILDYMGLEIPKMLQGKSILPQIYNTSTTVNDAVYTEFTRYEVDHDGFGGLQMMRAIITERYKLVIHLLDTDEFYDMKNDPDELSNLINEVDYTEIRNQLHDQLLEHMNQTRDLYRGYQWKLRSWRKDVIASWHNDGYTRQKENDEYETRQLDYDTGLVMVEATRKKFVHFN